MTLAVNSSPAFPVALNKHGIPVAGPSSARWLESDTSDSTGLQNSCVTTASHHYSTIVTKIDTPIPGEREETGIEHHI